MAEWEWECHVCTKRNGQEADRCCCCGRGRERRAQTGLGVSPLIFGVGSMRAEQVESFLREAFHGLPKIERRRLPKKMLTLPKEEFEAEMRVLVLSGPGGPVNDADEFGFTPVHLACLAGNAEILRVLVDVGGFLEAETREGWRPLHCAAIGGSGCCASELLTAGVDVAPTSRQRGQTPLHLAGNGRVARLLVDGGADPLFRDLQGQSPMHSAALRDSQEVAEVLIEAAGLKPATDCQDGTNFFPEQLAELHGHFGFVDFCKRVECEEKSLFKEALPKRPWHCTAWDDARRRFDAQKAASKDGPRRREILAAENLGVMALRTRLEMARLDNKEPLMLLDEDESALRPRGTESRMPLSGHAPIFDAYLNNLRSIESDFLVSHKGVYRRSYPFDSSKEASSRDDHSHQKKNRG